MELMEPQVTEEQLQFMRESHSKNQTSLCTFLDPICSFSSVFSHLRRFDVCHNWWYEEQSRRFDVYQNWWYKEQYY